MLIPTKVNPIRPAITGTLDKDPLLSHVSPIIFNKNVIKILETSRVFIGKPGTGNLAMFYAVLLIHSKKYLAL